MPKKVLISGGTGYLGRHLAKALVDEEVDILVRETSRRDILDKVNYVLKDDLKATYDCFIHMATAYGRKGESEEEIFATNKTLPLEVLRKIEKKGLVFIKKYTSFPLGLNSDATYKKEIIEKAK
ncbi:MAG: NAD-dependent epimerase/dehydratase family protein, partial [Bdellovibrionota bacterium]|nr:NAD-dependent epimerase/dehydratase family protein [Bdellovibrionota bacterium]